jgi:hypothetical protein
MKDDFSTGWSALMAEVLNGMRDWRVANAKATMREMELEIDKRFATAKARFLADMALASTAADLTKSLAEDRPVCRECGGRLSSIGQKKRKLRGTQGVQTELERSRARCSACGAEYFPPR